MLRTRGIKRFPFQASCSKASRERWRQIGRERGGKSWSERDSETETEKYGESERQCPHFIGGLKSAEILLAESEF